MSTLTTYHKIDQLVAKIREMAGDFDVVSFDVFDTLLIRRIHNPDLLKMATARYISNLARASGENWRPEKVQRLRDKVEAMHRRRAGRKFPDHEASYPLFMADVLGLIFGQEKKDRMLEDVTNFELSIESDFLLARVAFKDLLIWLKSQGKRVLAISDMYLPATHIKALLDKAGLEGLIDEVFSSADSMAAKASGAAWPLIREKLGLNAACWLHVGDNPISDGSRPCEAGISALVLQDVGEMHRKLLAKSYHEIAVKRPYWRGRLVQQYMLPMESENIPRSDLYRHGFVYFGPLLCAFVHHVAERAMAEGVERVYFLSREGEILREIWKTIAPVIFAGKKLPEDHYLYVSRMALAGAACAHEGLSHENARITFLPATNRDFRDVCRVFNLTPGPFLPILKRHGLDVDTPLSHWHDGWNPRNGLSFQRMVEHDADFQAEIKKQSLPANSALQSYLESEGFFSSGKVAVVDIGWLGNIQRFLYQATRHRADHPVIHGHLLVCAAGYPFPYAPDNQLEGFYHDHKKFGFTGSLLLYAQDLFEETTRANHPGLMAYSPNDAGGFELVFRPDNDACALNEKTQSDYFAPVQEGIRAAARRYGPAMSVMGYDAREMKPWLNVLTVNHIAYPRTRDVEILTRIHHLDDFAASRPPSSMAKKALRRLWNRPVWQLRFLPGLRAYHYLKHAVYWLRS